jgi:hypothetical protein
MTRNDDHSTWTTWTTPKERVRAVAITDGEPRSARGIAETAVVEADRTRAILAKLAENNVLVRAGRNGKTRYAVDRGHIDREAERLRRGAEDREQLLERQHDVLMRLHGLEEPVHQRMCEHHLRVIDAALDQDRNSGSN